MKELKDKVSVKPIVKWAGGKYKLSETIITEAIDHINIDSFNAYVDPFIGGGGMFFSITNKYDFKKKVISDINPQLINMYKQVQSNHKELIKELSVIEDSFNELSSDDSKKDYYLNLRKEFNKGIENENESLNQAVLFIALNKLGFNGLYRVNRKGFFNVPFGQKKKANLYDKDNVIAMSKLLKDTEILVADYKSMTDYAGNDTLYYFDSPYRPLPNSPSFTSYAKSSFNDESQKELADTCKLIFGKGSSFILSNSDPKQIDENDNYFDDLYSDFIIKRINARRAIGATAARRGLVSEILVLGVNKQK